MNDSQPPDRPMDDAPSTQHALPPEPPVSSSASAGEGLRGSEDRGALASANARAQHGEALAHLEVAELALWREDLGITVALPSLRAAVTALRAPASGPLPDLVALRCRELEQALAQAFTSNDVPTKEFLVPCAALRRALLAPSAARRRVELLLRIAAVVLALVCVVAYLRLRGVPGRGPWRGEYFAREDLSGSASLRFDDTIDFTWDKEPPHPELPPEKFSVRWESCLVVPRDIPDAAMQLVSDDGSRLFLDGELVIDGWAERKGVRTHGAETPLSAGTHTLRVEYFHKSGTPRVALVASLDGGPPSVIPASMLRRPSSAPGSRSLRCSE